MPPAHTDTRSREDNAAGAVAPPQELKRIAADRSAARLLMDQRVVTRDQYEEAVAMHAERGGRIVDNLLSLGHLSAEELVEFFLSNPRPAETEAWNIDIDAESIAVLDAETAYRLQAIPLDRAGSILLMGATQPLAEAVLADLEQRTGLTIRLVLCGEDDIEKALLVHYGPQADSSAAGGDTGRIEGLKAGTRLAHVGQLVQQVASLPALPETVSRIREIMDDPTSSVHDAAGVLTLDPPMAAKILSVANSAAYGFPNRINDLTLAVSLLGLRETYGIVLSVAVADLANKLKYFDYRAFWLESMCSAAAARIVAKAAGFRRLPGVFSAGLLHDIGRVVLVELQPNYMQSMKPGLMGRALVEEEQRVIGLSHTEAGYGLAQYWNLPVEIAEPIRFHHAPEYATTAKKYVSIVSLANVMACAPGDTLKDNENLFADCGAALLELRLDPEVVEAMLDEFLDLRSTALDRHPGEGEGD